MKLNNAILWLITLFFLFFGTLAHSQNDANTADDEAMTNLNLSERILLAHHLGSRPDDAPDIEDNVHGGDFPTDDPDSWDPGMPDQGSAPGPNDSSS